MLPIESKRLIEKFEKAFRTIIEGGDETRKRDQNLVAGPLSALQGQIEGYIQQQEINDRGKRNREIATIAGLFLTAALPLATAAIFFAQLRVSERSDRTFERTLVASNRAWLAPTLLEFVKSIDDADGPVIKVHYGNLATRRLLI